MSGLACIIVAHGLVEFKTVPTEPAQLPLFDKQIRECLSNPVIAESLPNDQPAKVMAVCEALNHWPLLAADRPMLLEVVNYYGYGS